MRVRRVAWINPKATRFFCGSGLFIPKSSHSWMKIECFYPMCYFIIVLSYQLGWELEVAHLVGNSVSHPAAQGLNPLPFCTCGLPSHIYMRAWAFFPHVLTLSWVVGPLAWVKKYIHNQLRRITLTLEKWCYVCLEVEVCDWQSTTQSRNYMRDSICPLYSRQNSQTHHWDLGFTSEIYITFSFLSPKRAQYLNPRPGSKATNWPIRLIKNTRYQPNICKLLLVIL